MSSDDREASKTTERKGICEQDIHIHLQKEIVTCSNEQGLC